MWCYSIHACCGCVLVSFFCSCALTREQFVQAMYAEMSERGVTVDEVTLSALFSIFDRDG